VSQPYKNIRDPDRQARAARGKSGTEVLQTIIITTGAQQKKGRLLLDSEHLRHESVGYGGRGERDRCKGMYRGRGGTNTLRLGEFTRGEPSRERGTRLSIHLGMKKQAYMNRGRSVEGIHKNTRGIERPGQARGRKATNERIRIYQIWGAGGKNSCGNRNASIPFCWKEFPPRV